MGRRGNSVGTDEEPRSGTTRRVRDMVLKRGVNRAFFGSLWLVALVLCAGFVVFYVSVPRTVPAAESGPLVVASLPFWHFNEGTPTVIDNEESINEVSPWMYGISADQRLVPQYPPDEAADARHNIERFRDAGIPVVPSLANITGGAWSYEPVERMLHDPVLRRQHVEDIVGLVVREEYTGIDLDYENLRAKDRKAFSSFVTELAAAMHAKGKVLSVALFAKTSDAGYDERNVAQDYAAIGRVADEVRLMAYDYHWATSGPGPVAPVGWVRNVLDYAKTQIPPERIVLGVPLYGYDWSDGRAVSVTWQEAFNLARDQQVRPHYDARVQAPWFRYTDDRGREHEVWFENAVSSKAKFEAARGSGIRGVYLWMYGNEDVGTWTSLRESMPVK